jgi:hypothetical protein
LYASPNVIRVNKSRRLRRTGHIAGTEEARNEYKILGGKREGKKPLGRHICRREDNIRLDLKETGLKLWTVRIWRAVVNTVINLWVPQ